MNILSSFLAGFLSTSFLFVLSLLIVFGVKYITLIAKEIAMRNSLQASNQVKRTPRKRKKPKTQSPERSIEIDPSQIDRIYVKKSS